MSINFFSQRTITLLITFLFFSISTTASCKPGDWLALNDKATEKYIAQDYKQSLVLLKKALAKLKTDTTADPEDFPVVYTNMAAGFRALGDYANAKIHYEKALLGFEKSIGKKNDDYANAANNFSIYLSGQGLFEESLKYVKESLRIRVELHGTVHLNVVTTLDTLAFLQLDMGDYKKAIKSSKRALENYKKLDKQEAVAAANLEASLGFIYRGTGDFESALIHTQKSLKVFDKHLPAIHTSTANALNEMGLIYNHQGKFKKAIPYYKKALSIYKKVHGEEHTYYVMVLGNIADNLSSEGNYEMAEAFHLETIERLVGIFGKDHHDVAIRLNNYAQMKVTQGDYKAAYKVISEAIRIDLSLLGNDHPSTKNSIDICKAIIPHLDSKGSTCGIEPVKQSFLAKPLYQG